MKINNVLRKNFGSVTVLYFRNTITINILKKRSREWKTLLFAESLEWEMPVAPTGSPWIFKSREWKHVNAVRPPASHLA